MGKGKRRGRREREGGDVGREGNGGKGENDLTHPLSQISGYATVCNLK